MNDRPDAKHVNEYSPFYLNFSWDSFFVKYRRDISTRLNPTTSNLLDLVTANVSFFKKPLLHSTFDITQKTFSLSKVHTTDITPLKDPKQKS